MKRCLFALFLTLALPATQATHPAMQHRYRHFYPQLNAGTNEMYGKTYLDPRSVSYDGEASLRDLDVDVGIGVADNDQDTNPSSQQYAQDVSPSSKQVNIGLYTDPIDDPPAVLYNPQTYPRSPTANYFNPIQPQRNLYDVPVASLPYPYSSAGQYPYPYPQRAFSYQQVPALVQNPRSPVESNERFRVGSYERDLPRRTRGPVKQLIVNEEGAPVMVAEPYGNRRVGTFKLLNDQGYHVTMNVPPSPTGVADGILVMEMKATLYRPVN